MFTRGNKLYDYITGLDGKRVQIATGCDVGEEDRARRFVEARQAEVDAARRAGAIEGALSVTAYSKPWLKQRKELGLDWQNDEQRLRDHVLPLLGHKRVADVRPRDLVELFHKLRSSGKLAPRTIRNIYSVVSALFRDARLEGLIEQTPAILTEYQLGKVVDRDTSWRGDAVFTKSEVELLVTDPRLPLLHRTIYAVKALCGPREGELAALTLRHYEREREPLHGLVVARSYHKDRTKTGRARRVPVHPVAAMLLGEWILSGWAAMFGRAPGPDDLLFPVPPDPPKKQARRNPRAGGMRNDHDTHTIWERDLKLLGLRARRGHDLRATMITLLEDAGADPKVVKKLTHPGKSGGAYEGYSRTQWQTYCREVIKLELDVRARGEVLQLPIAVGAPAMSQRTPDAVVMQSSKLTVLTGEKWRSGRDLNPSDPPARATTRVENREFTGVTGAPSRAGASGPASEPDAGAKPLISACDLGLAALRAEYPTEEDPG